MYESSYPGQATESGDRENDPYVAIDVAAVAQKIGCSSELLFGRLYYHLDHKYRYTNDDGSIVPLFYLKVGDKRHAIHFPYLASILAGENRDFLRQIWTMGVSVVALALSLASLLVAIYRH
jgi:hypothetical protein